MSGNLCLRGALRATTTTTTTSSSSTSTTSRSLLSTQAQALRHNGATGMLFSLASRRYATSSAAAAAAATSIATADAPQSLTAEIVDSSLAEKKTRERLERIVRRHLEHMSDPWKIAQYVDDALSKDRFDEALLLTQKASKDGQVVVSWNHLINYQLVKDNIKQAVKLFNEMKKRGQLPNVQTFTIIFRGCARSNHPKLAIAEAMKHYNMLLSDPRLQPNSTHLNAVLNVCARAGDLDSLFLAAESINDSSRAPTAYTYATIFNALRHHALASTRDVSPDQQQRNVQKAIDRAKSIWTEVVDKWRRGRLLIDEELVCAMGRLLLLSRSRDEKRGILDLIEQTMNIPNIVAASPDQHPDALADPLMHNIAAPATTTTAASSSSSSPSTPIPAPVPVPVPTNPSAVYAVPGRNTLALVLTILASAKLTTSGIKYWNLMVQHYGIVPDTDNWLRLFGMLKVARASAHAASVLDILPAALTHPLPYRIAMEACVRDNVNPRAVANADRVLDAMLARLPVADLHALRLYLRVALVSHYQLREKAQAGDEAAAKRAYGAQILAALDRLWEPYKRTHFHYFKESSSSASSNSTTTTPPSSPSSSAQAPERRGHSGAPLGEKYNGKREVVALARLMFSAFNKVQNERMLPDAEIRKYRPRYAKINREIQAFFSDREAMEPSLPSTSGRGRRDSGRQDTEEANESELTLGEEEARFAAKEGDPDAESGIRHGGDFIWNTTKPVDIITRRERRRKETEGSASSRRHRDDKSARGPRTRR